MSDESPGRSESARMIESWTRNAAAWTDAVRKHGIASRRAGTDAAIVAAVVAARPRRVLDVGCGEGWLARALAAEGCGVVGIDVSPALVEAARALGGARFEAIDYAALDASARALGAPFDAAVCNFSLLDDDAVATLSSIRALLDVDGRLFVQTVHPWSAHAGEYADGWRVETFAGFGDGFAAPMPWYFRTLASWIDALVDAGFVLDRCVEPVDPETGRPLSLLLSARSAQARTAERSPER